MIDGAAGAAAAAAAGHAQGFPRRLISLPLPDYI